MKFLKRFVLLILLLVLALIGIGYILPEQASVERDIRIDAPPGEIFPYVNNFRRFNEWSPWADWSEDIEYRYSGPESGIGARMAWDSDNPDVGSGSSLITESRPPNHVATRLDMGARGSANAAFDIQPAGGASRVSWSFRTSFGNDIIGRYFGLMLERWVGQGYDEGLQSLKALVEQPEPADTDADADDPRASGQTQD